MSPWKSEIVNYTTVPEVDSGWEKISVTFTPDTSGTYSLAVVQDRADGVAYCDDMQLEAHAAASNANLVQNGTFASGAPDYWTANRYEKSDEHPLGVGMGVSMHAKGSSVGGTRTSQVVPINYYAGSATFLLSGWGKANSVGGTSPKPEKDGDRYFGLIAEIRYANGTTYNYTTLSGKVMRQQWGSKSLEFVYDDGNQPFAMIYNDGSTSTLYYYVLNAQGDVIALLNANGTLAASYNYGAWGNYSVHGADGKKTTDATFIGHINPLRYRGYYYDRETRLYYLQSRYYDFANCRFINADGVVTTNVAEFLECNMFAYCTNNPINFSDEDGRCYYANGVWTHDAWENIGGYEKKPEPKGVTGTYGSVSAAWGIAGSVSVARVTDSRGNEALAITAGFGGGLGGGFSIDAAQKEFKAGDPGLSLGVVYYPDASVVWDLQGWGVAVGGTCILVSGEVSSSTINGYSIAPAFGADFHALITYTWVVPINDRSRKGR